MGTRGLIVIQKNKEYKLSQYVQFDSYPSGMGVQILNFLSQLNKNQLDVFSNNVDKLKNVTEEEYKKFWEDLGIIEKYVGMEDAERFYKKHPTLSRELGCEILDIILKSEQDTIETILDLKFVKNSLFCEWAYVIDLDEMTFEVFKGFNKRPLSKKERFYDTKNEDGYYPVRLLKEYDIDGLPDPEEFVRECEDEIP